MDKIAEAGFVVIALLGFVGWLGGGRKWAFRTMVSALILAAVVVAGILLYAYGTDKVAEHRARKLHECAVAKVADPKCDEVPKKGSTLPRGAFICPAYFLPDNASPPQEEEALAAAEQECREEVDVEQKSLHEQIIDYKRKHRVSDPYAAIAKPIRALGPTECAAKVRGAYPAAYNDMDDATLTKKVLAKYPHYCDATSSPPDFIPEIKGSR
jgi:hypothetical protein